MNLSIIKDSLIRRLSVNYVSYLGEHFKTNKKTEDWCEGYFQAKKDTETFLKQLEVFHYE